MVDISIVVILILFALIGLKRGTFKSIIYLAAIFIVAIVSFEFKDYIANVLMKLLPFLKFKGSFDGITVVNVLFYKGLAFLIVFALLMLILSILIKVSGLLDLLVKSTIIFEIPSRILGMIIGLAEGVVICYAGLFFLVLIPVNENPIKDSKIAPYIINNTPVLNKVFDKSYKLSKNVYKLIEEKIENNSSEEVNEDALDELKKNGLITESELNELKKNGKEIIKGVVKKTEPEEKEKENKKGLKDVIDEVTGKDSKDTEETKEEGENNDKDN